MKNLLVNLLIIAVFSSCASTELVHISVLEPAPVTLPAYIKNVVVINRTGVLKKLKVFDVVDKVTSMEGANLDKDGPQATILGLTDELRKNNRFDLVTMLTGTVTSAGLPGMFPAPLPWD